METIIKTNTERTDAYLFLKKFVQKYLKENFDKLSEKYKITKEDLSLLKKDENATLEWVLGEFLDDNEFKELGITVFSEWGDDDVHTTVYKVGKKFIKSSFKTGYYMIDHKIEFVKLVRKKVVIYSYEPIK